jgi:predicted XRE-type DNA-binding protein
MKRKTPVHASDGNVFADLSIQAKLTRLIYLRLCQLGVTQIQAARRLDLKQPDVSKLMNGRHTGFSAERLFRLLNALDQDVRIIITPKPPRRRATITVAAA